jgi:hypothetical protein
MKDKSLSAVTNCARAFISANQISLLVLQVYFHLLIYLIQINHQTRCNSFISSLLAVGRGLPEHEQQLCYRRSPTVKPEIASAVVCS